MRKKIRGEKDEQGRRWRRKGRKEEEEEQGR